MHKTPERLLSRKLLAKNSLINFAGSFLPVLVALFAIPWLIRSLGVERFGILSLVWMLVGYFSLFDLGLGRAVTKLVADKIGCGDNETIPELIGTAMLLMLLLSLLGVGLLTESAEWLVADFLNISRELQRETTISLYWVAAILPFLINTSALRGVLVAYQQFGLINAIKIPQGVLNFLAPLAVLPFSSNLVPVIASLALLRILVWFAHLFVCCRYHPHLFRRITCKKNIMRPLFRFGGWMTVTNLISPLMTYLDRFFIGSMVSVAALSFYTAPYQVINKLIVFPGSLLSVLFPAFATALESDVRYAYRLFKNGTLIIVFMLFPLITFLVLFAHEGLQLWLGTEFAEKSTIVLQILALGMLINCLALVPFTFLQSAGRPDLTAKFHLLELPFYMGMLYLVVPKYGIAGAASVWSLRIIFDCGLLYGAMRIFFSVEETFFRCLFLQIFLSLFFLTPVFFLSDLRIKFIFLFAWLSFFSVTGYKLLLEESHRLSIQRGLLSLWQRL